MSRLQLPKLQIQFQSNDRFGSLADTSRIGHNQPVVLTRTGHSGPTHPLLI
jgi:hypothetical protein